MWKISITTTLSFFLLLLYETVNFSVSAYQPNSSLFLRDFLFIVCCIFLIDKLLKKKRYRNCFVVFISLMAGLLALLNIPIFFFKYYESTIYGFNDFSQFRFLYMPWGFLSNEWVTILLCLLPFPLIGLLLFRQKTWIRYGFIFILGSLGFNILISFSRAGILAFLLFIGLLNLLFYFNRLFSIKKLLFANAVLIFLFVGFAFCFFESIQSSVKQTHSHQRSTEGRLKQWEQLASTIDRAPFFGIGSKNYALLRHSAQQPELENSFTGRVNSTYIQLLIEKGWIGLLLWLCVIGIFVFHIFWRIKKGENQTDKAIDCIIFSGILAVLFREIFFSSLLYNSGLLFLFFILLIFNRKEGKKNVTIRKPIAIGLLVLFVSGFVFLHIKRSDNSLAYATAGLKYERSNSINEAIKLYEKAIRQNPYDALFQHNLGRLYYINNQPDSALFYLSKAILSDPNVALYHIGKGLFIESQNPDEAFDSYKQAVLLSPDITDSQFFKDLKERYLARAEKLLQNALDDLLQIQSIRYSSIIEAKIGKLRMSLGETDCAYETLTHVTQFHPNLNRPWYYIGLIEQSKDNYDAMQTAYKKSLFLSPFDHLPLYALASYYKDIGDERKADSYFKAAEKAWKNKRSVHSTRCKRMYYSGTEKDDVIPQGFLDYITPVFQKQYEH